MKRVNYVRMRDTCVQVSTLPLERNTIELLQPYGCNILRNSIHRQRTH